MGIGEGRKRMAVSLEGRSDRSEGEQRSARGRVRDSSTLEPPISPRYPVISARKLSQRQKETGGPCRASLAESSRVHGLVVACREHVWQHLS